MKTMTVSMICAGLMTMGTAAIAAGPVPQDEAYTLLAMSHEDMEEHDEMGGGEMSREEMGDEMSDGMEKDEMGHDGMSKDDAMGDDEMENGDDDTESSGMSD